MLQDKSDKSLYKPNRYFLELIVGAGFTRTTARKIYNAFFKHITEALAAGEAVRIKGFGRFQVHQRRVRSGPAGDEAVVKQVRLRPSEQLKMVASEPVYQELIPSRRTGAVATVAQQQTSIVEEGQADEFETHPKVGQLTMPIPIPEQLLQQQQERQLAQFEIHYNKGIAYKEMSLYDLAVKELESAIGFIDLDDKERRFAHCCSLLGLCYTSMNLYHLAEKWLLRGLQIAGRTENEYKALRYDLGLVYEAWGKIEKASEAFFDVYAIDINFRRVGQKLKVLQTRYIKVKRGERRQQFIPIVIRGRDSNGERFEEETLILNISRRGAGLRVSRALEPGSFLELFFVGVQRVKVAKVVWCASIDMPEGGYQAGVLVYHEPPNSNQHSDQSV
ncbi:MAG: HU family DNA-binding protein [Acidobacteriota bacterium]